MRSFILFIATLLIFLFVGCEKTTIEPASTHQTGETLPPFSDHQGDEKESLGNWEPTSAPYTLPDYYKIYYFVKDDEADGDFYLAGNYPDSYGNKGFFTGRMTAEGDSVFLNYFGGSDREVPVDIEVGDTSWYVIMETGPALVDSSFVYKYSKSSGDVIWSQYYPYNKNVAGMAVNNGKLYIADTHWGVVLDACDGSLVSGPTALNIYPYDIKVRDNHIFVGGGLSGPGNGDIGIICYDLDFNIEWYQQVDHNSERQGYGYLDFYGDDIIVAGGTGMRAGEDRHAIIASFPVTGDSLNWYYADTTHIKPLVNISTSASGIYVADQWGGYSFSDGSYSSLTPGLARYLVVSGDKLYYTSLDNKIYNVDLITGIRL